LSFVQLLNIDQWTIEHDHHQFVNIPQQNFEKKYKEERKYPPSIQFSNWDSKSPFEMASFAGTTQKCTACEKKVYWVEQLTADNKVYHKSCFRCHHCKGTLKVRPKLLNFLCYAL